MQKKGFSSSFLRDTRISVNHSRISDINSHRSNNSRINTSFDLLDSSLIDTSLEQQPILPSSLRSQIIERKTKTRKSDHAKRNYLNRVVITRMINIRLALKKMQDIPRALFRKGPRFYIAKELIMKSKVNLQTSLIRTLIYSYQDTRKDETTKLQLERGSNTFVTATSGKNLTRQREALYFLTNLFKDNIRFCLKQFQINRQKIRAIQRYFSKVCSRYEEMRQQALRNIKFLPDRHKHKAVDQIHLTINRLTCILQNINIKKVKLSSQAFSSVKAQSLRVRLAQQYAAKTMITFSKLRKEHAFYLWLNIASECKEKEVKQARIEQEKIRALKRIVERNYLKLFIEISRRIMTFRKVALKLACCSCINQQKSLWRLFIHCNKGSKSR